MTNPNRYNPRPEICSVICKSCGKEADFRNSFSFCDKESLKQWGDKLWPRSETVRWGKGYVIQHDPSIHKWKPPPYGGYLYSHTGISKCSNCMQIKEYRLSWPGDAFFKCEIDSEVLWAWDREYAATLLKYIESNQRRVKKSGAFLFILHIPKVFLSKNRRTIVAARIKKMLGNIGSMD